MSQQPHYKIRLATKEDIPTLRKIEYNAATRFESIPELSHLSSIITLPDAKAAQWLSQGKIYMAISTQTDEPEGFLVAHPMDSSLLVAEISVDLETHGKGVGTFLLQEVFNWARERARYSGGKARVSLMTYREVAWNAPWYRRREFKEVPAEELGPEHVVKMEFDVGKRGLEKPGYSRCCMLWEEDGQN